MFVQTSALRVRWSARKYERIVVQLDDRSTYAPHQGLICIEFVPDAVTCSIENMGITRYRTCRWSSRHGRSLVLSNVRLMERAEATILLTLQNYLFLTGLVRLLVALAATRLLPGRASGFHIVGTCTPVAGLWGRCVYRRTLFAMVTKGRRWRRLPDLLWHLRTFRFHPSGGSELSRWHASTFLPIVHICPTRHLFCRNDLWQKE